MVSAVLPEKIRLDDDMTCRPGVMSYDVTLKGGLSAGSFFPLGSVDNMEACVTQCCHRNSCDVAFMLKDSCFSITCASEELCEQVPAPSTDFSPRLSYVRRERDRSRNQGALQPGEGEGRVTNAMMLYDMIWRVEWEW